MTAPAARAPGALLRQTRTTCPRCIRPLPGELVQDGNSVWLERACPDCGPQRTLLSQRADYYRDVDRYYFRVMDRPLVQRDFLVRVTEACNLDCPICLAKANTEDTPDLSFDTFVDWMGDRRGLHVDLVSSEPTLRPDLPRFIRHIRQRGNVATLHTNGLKLAGRDYVRELVDAGLQNVVLQFDGFDDEATARLRGRAHLVKARLKAMDHLRDLGVSTRLNVVIGRGLNEGQIGPVLDFACQTGNEFIKAVYFLGVRLLGSAVHNTASEDELVSPDEMIDFVCDATGGRISRDGVRAFQKLYFAYLSAFHVRKCFYVQHYLVLRDGKGSYTPFEELVRTADLDGAFERFARLRPHSRGGALALLAAEVAARADRAQVRRLAGDLLRLQALLYQRFNPEQVPSRFLLVSFPTACDPLNYDASVATNCSIGELSADLGVTDGVAGANIARERLFRTSDRAPGSRPRV